jgi:uncharacterized protein
MTQTALITGASAGIGKQFAYELGILRGYNLILVARRLERLEAIKADIEEGYLIEKKKPPIIHLISADISKYKDRVYVTNEADRFQIDLLINNAGYGSVGQFTNSELDWEANMVIVNCIAPLHFCHHFLPKMRARSNGVIINVSSTISFQPFPFMATYGASKAFLRNFSLALSYENTGKVLVITHCPGPTESEFHIVAGLEHKLSYVPKMTAEQVVSQTLTAMDRGRRLVVNGRLNKLLALIATVIPPNLSARIVSLIMKKHA